jgi:hypothetical protein
MWKSKWQKKVGLSRRDALYAGETDDQEIDDTSAPPPKQSQQQNILTS